MAETGMMADIAAVTDNNRPYAYPMMPFGMGGYGNGFGFGGDWIGLIVLALLFGGGFGGFGGFGGAGGMGLGGGLLGYALGNNATKTDLSDGLVSLQTSNKIDNLSTQVNNGFSNAATQLCGGLADVTAAVTIGTNSINTGLLSGFANTQLQSCQNTNAITNAIDNARFAQQQCCCDIKEQAAYNANALQAAIANSDNQAFRNMCELKDSIREQGEATRALIAVNEVTNLREQLALERQKVQNARFDASQLAQTTQLINQLQPVSKPAYITASPYQSIYPFGNGCGCGNYGWNQFIS
jgi:hypothetical protein